MCQYSAQNGRASDWHRIHLGTLSQSGAGLLILEAAAVVPEGRISYADLGLYDDATEQALAEVLQSVRRWSPMPIGIQLAHAGRKASTDLPWKAARPSRPTTRMAGRPCLHRRCRSARDSRRRRHWMRRESMPWWTPSSHRQRVPNGWA